MTNFSSSFHTLWLRLLSPPNFLDLLLLCSQLGLEDDSVKPLTLHEWNPIVRKMQTASLRPSDLLQQPEHELRLKFDLDTQSATRINQLTSRDIERELTRLASIGISPLTTRTQTIPKNIVRV